MPPSKLTKRNASVITFSDLKMMNSHEMNFKKQDKVENNIFPEENKEPKNTIKKEQLKRFYIRIKPKKIKYRKMKSKQTMILAINSKLKKK